jgi:hypothetical protein
MQPGARALFAACIDRSHVAAPTSRESTPSDLGTNPARRCTVDHAPALITPQQAPMNDLVSIQADRVRANTDAGVLAEIDRCIEDRIQLYAQAPTEVLSRRIRELEQEWDVERVLETNASILALIGVILGLTSSRKWLVLSAGVLSFLLQHAIQGWCPPIPLLRRIGVRTQPEIDAEKAALQAMRGDFDGVRSLHNESPTAGE